MKSRIFYAGVTLALGYGLISSVVGCSSSDRPTSTPAPVELGLACSADTACTSGVCFLEAGSSSGVSWTAGTCTQSCSVSSTCPLNSSCVALADGTAWCLARCAQSSNCRGGYVCSSAVEACLPDCRLGFSCGTTLSCDSATGACVPGTRATGAECALGSDCMSGVCTLEQAATSGKQWAGGYCTQACSTTVACDAAASCVAYDDGSSYCAASCNAKLNCRAGYVCSAEVCLPDCRQGWSCGTVLTCDSATGACLGKMRAIGAPCALNVDCASGLCTPAQGTTGGSAWSDGYCTSICDTANTCPAPSKCITYADGSACAASCVTNTDCRSGYVCSAAVGACLPDCRQGWSCGNTLTCDQTTGSCA